jgi:hypothetical protein
VCVHSTVSDTRLFLLANIVDCARRAGITDSADITKAWTTAEQAGFLVSHVTNPLVMLAESGSSAGRWEAMHKRKPYKCSICGAAMPNEPKPVLQHQMSHAQRKGAARSAATPD